MFKLEVGKMGIDIQVYSGVSTSHVRMSSGSLYPEWINLRDLKF